MRPVRSRIIFELILGGVMVTSLALILRQWRRIAEFQRRQDADAQSLRLLKQALAQKGLRNVPSEVIEAPAGNDVEGIARREATIERLDLALAEANVTISNLQSQLAAANDQSAKAQASAQESLQKQQSDSQAQLDDLQKRLDAAVAQSAIARQRVAALEADNTKLTSETAAVATQTTDLSHIVASLRDLDRRRDSYLTSILRRYRDITGEFRAMSSMLDMSHDPNREPSSGACSDAALSRIQNAVTSAEDDLRQINELNDRTQKLEKRLPRT